MSEESRQHVVNSKQEQEGRQHVVNSKKESIQHEESRQETVDSKKQSRQQTACSRQGKTKGFLSTVYRLLPTKKDSLPTTYCLLSTKSGFTLVELLITMTVFVLVIAAASNIFSGLLTQFKQQSKITETNIEGIVGLEILRQDIEHAGYGLPWNGLIAYNEAAGAPASNFNDSTTNPPRAIVTGNNVAFFSGLNSTFNGTDYLVIKSTNVARSATSQKWTHLRIGNVKTTWTPDCENVNKESDCTTNNTVRVIVISPGSTDANSHSLVVSGGAFFTQYGSTSGFAPSDATDTRIIYGVDPDTDLRMPFNRADYFIRRFDASNNNITPSHCASNTGVFEKVTVNQNGGGLTNFMPLLDCVADMQVVFRLDMDENGTAGTNSNANGSDVNGSEGATVATVQATLADPSLLRMRVKEVRVYILAHEGQRDVNYTYPNAVITIGEFGVGRNFDLTTITNYQNYRWKVYTIVVKPKNLK